ncbi:MAG: FkbM family methyltransferase [Bacteroidetes bacterium]|nr:FkbM family methyltransferase [Bacteroidota bacterium]
MIKSLIKRVLPDQVVKIISTTRVNVNKSLSKDYSQSGETKFIRDVMKDYPERDFVEIGANDGVTVSTTLGLIKSGWRGISVEANPKIYDLLKSNLSKYRSVKTLCCAVSPTKGPVRLFFGKDDPQGLLSTICADNNEWFDEHRSAEFVVVEGIPLTELLERENVSKRFGLLLIDTEGMDLDILQTLDFSKFRPRLIVTEQYGPKNDIKHALLTQHGYQLIKTIGCNTLWLDSKNSI